MAARPRRRPLSREEALALQQRRQHQREMEEESRELARGPIDLPFLVLTMLLTGIGLIMLLSASFPSAYYETEGSNPMSYFIRQGVFAIMGVAAMLLIGKINYQRFRALAKPLLYLAVILLLLVLIPGNPLAITRNNATRWLGIPGTSLQFQPSEVAKLAIVLYFSDSISKKKDLMRTFRYGIAPYAIILIAVAGLVGLEPHLSGAMLILGAGAVLMLVGGIHWAWVGGAIGAAATMMYTVLFVIGYNTSRITYWLDPWKDAQGKGYQLAQSLLTIGSGGLLGVGLGKSRQKFLYLPEEHNDFIFAIVCEELGLIGATLIMLLFAALILRGFWIALHARDRFGSLMVVGITTLVEDDDNPAMAVGGLTHGVTPLEMAGAYAGIANMGKFNKPTPIIKILDRNGKVLYEHKTNPTQAVKPESAYMMISMMEDVMTRGTGRGAAISRPCAGKSGTTDNYHDAWFVGFTPNLACAVWIGDDNNESLGGMTGGGQPATLWRAFMSGALDGIPAEDFEKPDGFKMPAPKYEAPKPQPKKQTTKKQDTKKKDSKKEDALPGGGNVPQPPRSGKSSTPPPVRPPKQ